MPTDHVTMAADNFLERMQEILWDREVWSENQTYLFKAKLSKIFSIDIYKAIQLGIFLSEILEKERRYTPEVY